MSCLTPQVQPKLQNFMFPVVPERPVILAELFSSIFGSGTAARANGAAAGSARRAPAERAAAAAAASDEPILQGSLFAPTG